MMKRYLWGAFLVLLGVMAFVQGAGYNVGFSFWPMVIAVAGLSILINSVQSRSFWVGGALGLWLTAIGTSDILYNAGLIQFTGRDVLHQGWPLLLIAVGLSVVFGFRRFWGIRVTIDPQDFRMVGDLRYGQTPWQLDKDLTLEHGVGDVKVDLTTAEITPGTHQLQVRSGIGEIWIRVPDDLSVIVTAKVGMGDAQVLREHRSGMGVVLHTQDLVENARAEVHVTVKLGMGSLRITRGTARPPLLAP